MAISLLPAVVCAQQEETTTQQQTNNDSQQQETESAASEDTILVRSTPTSQSTQTNTRSTNCIRAINDRPSLSCAIYSNYCFWKCTYLNFRFPACSRINASGFPSLLPWIGGRFLVLGLPFDMKHFDPGLCKLSTLQKI